jgi:threonine dehydrogenase-like Zn-dependent dehydrogenase
MSVDERMLIEPLCVTVHSWNRANSLNIINFGSTVLVQGCGPIGLICIAVLRTLGIENIVAVDGEDKRLEFAKLMGANATVNFKNFQGAEALAEGVKNVYTVTTKKSAMLDFHDVIMRIADGKIFRITSDGDDNKTPKSATLDMRQVSAEEWSLPI